MAVYYMDKDGNLKKRKNLYRTDKDGTFKKVDDEDTATVVTSKDGRKTEYIGWTDDEIRQIEESKGKPKELFGGWLQEGTLSDGYQTGDVTKAIFGTLADFGFEAVKGVGGLAEGLVDLGSYGVSGVADLVGADETAKSIKKFAQRNLVDEVTAHVSDWLNQYSV